MWSCGIDLKMLWLRPNLSRSIRGRPSLYPPLRIHQRKTKFVPTSQVPSEEDQVCNHLSGSIRGRPSLYPPLRIHQRKTKPVSTHLSGSIRGRPSLYPPLRIYQRKTKHVPTSPDLLEEDQACEYPPQDLVEDGQDCTHLRNW